MASTLDAALGGLREDVDTHAETLAGCGNCQLYSGSYVGTGSVQPVTHTFPGKPLVVMVGDGNYGSAIIAWRGMSYATPATTTTLNWRSPGRRARSLGSMTATPSGH